MLIFNSRPFPPTCIVRIVGISMNDIYHAYVSLHKDYYVFTSYTELYCMVMCLCDYHLPRKVILPASLQGDTLLYRA